MKLAIPKTLQLLTLQDYDPKNAELGGVSIVVWVDPPRSVLAEFDKLSSEYAAALLGAGGGTKKKPESRLATDICRRALSAWYARLWSQGTLDTHWTPAELESIEEHNPVFLEWLCRQTWALIEEQRISVKKKIEVANARSGDDPILAAWRQYHPVYKNL